MSALPYPEPADRHVTTRMKANRRADTRPEVKLRSSLHRAGFRFRKDHAVVVVGRKVRPDIVFPARRIAVFVDGCFWHCCPDHGTVPARNVDYWGPKLTGNVERDRATTAVLESEGWRVIRVWEHEDLSTAQARIATALEGR